MEVFCTYGLEGLDSLEPTLGVRGPHFTLKVTFQVAGLKHSLVPVVAWHACYAKTLAMAGNRELHSMATLLSQFSRSWREVELEPRFGQCLMLEDVDPLTSTLAEASFRDDLLEALTTTGGWLLSRSMGTPELLGPLKTLLPRLSCHNLVAFAHEDVT